MEFPSLPLPSAVYHALFLFHSIKLFLFQSIHLQILKLQGEKH